MTHYYRLWPPVWTECHWLTDWHRKCRPKRSNRSSSNRVISLHCEAIFNENLCRRRSDKSCQGKYLARDFSSRLVHCTLQNIEMQFTHLRTIFDEKCLLSPNEPFRVTGFPLFSSVWSVMLQITKYEISHRPIGRDGILAFWQRQTLFQFCTTRFSSNFSFFIFVSVHRSVHPFSPPFRTWWISPKNRNVLRNLVCWTAMGDGDIVCGGFFHIFNCHFRFSSGIICFIN